MSGSHGHASHGHGAAVAEAHHGSAEIPPAPAQRSISPAPEDFVNLPGPAAMAWPFLWIGIALLLIVSLLAYGWHPWAGHAEDGGHGAGEHAPAHR